MGEKSVNIVKYISV